jgi:translation elongation factor EF-Tu-like GTPase
MPQTREGMVRVAKGVRAGSDKLSRAAIILVTGDGSARVDDRELLQLVELETRELVKVYLGRRASQTLPLIRSDDPDLAEKIRSLPPLVPEQP